MELDPYPAELDPYMKQDPYESGSISVTRFRMISLPNQISRPGFAKEHDWNSPTRTGEGRGGGCPLPKKSPDDPYLKLLDYLVAKC